MAYLTDEQKRGFLPDLTEQQMTELIRIYINSHPGSVAYEQVKKMRQLAKSPDIFLKAQMNSLAEKMGMVLNGFAETDEEVHQYQEEARNVEHLKESVRSYAYTKEFWEEHIVECPYCKAQADATLAPDSFMYFKKPYFYRLSPATYLQVRNTLKKNQQAVVTLPCGHTVKLGSSGVYYRWWTVRSDVPTGPRGQLVEPVEVVNLL